MTKSLIRIVVLLALFNLIVIAGIGQNSFTHLCDSAEAEINNGKLESALLIYEKAFEQGSTDSAKVIWAASICSMCADELKDEKAVIKYNNIAIEHGATDRQMIDQQLDLAKKHKDLETIETVLLRLKSNPEITQKYTSKLMYFYYNNKRYAETLRTADEMLGFNPNNVNARYFKGVALLNTDHEESGIEVLEGILNDHPDNEKANYQLGVVYYNKASAVFDNANKKYKSIETPTRVDFHNYTEEIQKAKKDYQKALPYLEKSNSIAQKEYLDQAISLAKNRLKQLAQD
ncbi:hypothetical protein [uncultured Draconibacterium sp.]|uniref:tetratricopeptide repeat protein n=1 Tax=uncultured Draconibacterium sp. TaxID=1573823 RepID=UPI0029C63635|nr:hypothetical protein [uncultured Draconibacterium sp.]